ncbi:hypothetical protein NDU88_000133 [Pleurodeles waltl]|uniref:Uncharacterized protein n=1 Tax=Pleurodeles waltl TaxID=8319 RepID=A0AAV7KPX1_PLEWA|nr:hypothetical protein NDU88_000133 [Pleurodeles waltl]
MAPQRWYPGGWLVLERRTVLSPETPAGRGPSLVTSSDTTSVTCIGCDPPEGSCPTLVLARRALERGPVSAPSVPGRSSALPGGPWYKYNRRLLLSPCALLTTRLERRGLLQTGSKSLFTSRLIFYPTTAAGVWISAPGHSSEH